MDTRKLSVGRRVALLAGAGAWAFAQPGNRLNPLETLSPKEEKEGDEEEVITLDKAPRQSRAPRSNSRATPRTSPKVIKEEDDGTWSSTRSRVQRGGAGGDDQVQRDLLRRGRPDGDRAATEAKLPAAVMAALQKDYPKATFADPQVVTKMFYEIEVVIDGKSTRSRSMPRQHRG